MTARKSRDQQIPIAEFEMPLDDAIALLMRPSEVAPGDSWRFQVAGTNLKIFRFRASIEGPVDPHPNHGPDEPPGQSGRARG